MALSGMLCTHRDGLRDGEDAIAYQKRGAKIGGVVDLHDIYVAQGQIMREKDSIKSLRAAMKQIGVVPVSCKDKLVRAVAYCINAYMADEGCEQEAIMQYVRIANHLGG